MGGWVVFCVKFPSVPRAWFSIYYEVALLYLYRTQLNSISIDLNLRCRIPLLAIPDTIELSIFIGVGGYRCPNSPNILLR